MPGAGVARRPIEGPRSGAFAGEARLDCARRTAQSAEEEARTMMLDLERLRAARCAVTRSISSSSTISSGRSICRPSSPIFRWSAGTAAFRSARCAAARHSAARRGARRRGVAPRDRGEVRDRSGRAPDDDHGARQERRQGRPHPHRFGDQADHPAALHEPGLGSRAGRLRLLRGADDLDDCAAEIAPLAGTMVAFRRSDRVVPRPLPASRRAAGRCSSIGSPTRRWCAASSAAMPGRRG